MNLSRPTIVFALFVPKTAIAQQECTLFESPSDPQARKFTVAPITCRSVAIQVCDTGSTAFSFAASEKAEVTDTLPSLAWPIRADVSGLSNLASQPPSLQGGVKALFSSFSSALPLRRHALFDRVWISRDHAGVPRRP